MKNKILFWSMMVIAVILPTTGFTQQDSTRLLENTVEHWMLQIEDLANE